MKHKTVRRNTIIAVIIWHALQAVKMRQILCSDWLPQRTRWSDTALSGFPVFFRKNIFRDSKKIFCDSSVGMEPENEKTESVNDNENKKKKTKMLMVNTKVKTQKVIVSMTFTSIALALLL